MLDRLVSMPNVGHLYRRGPHPIRRMLLPQIRHHIYYRIQGTELIQVTTFWGATRKKGPLR